MTIPEAAQLVIQAGAMAKGGDVFVLDMGKPVKIFDLAKRMVELSGLTLKNDSSHDGDIKIEVTGLRPGEKLFEELLMGDNPLPTDHQLIMRAQDSFIEIEELKPKIEKFEEAILKNDVGEILFQLKKLVSSYEQKNGIVDWVYNEKIQFESQSKKNLI